MQTRILKNMAIALAFLSMSYATHAQSTLEIYDVHYQDNTRNSLAYGDTIVVSDSTYCTLTLKIKNSAQLSELEIKFGAGVGSSSYTSYVGTVSANQITYTNGKVYPINGSEIFFEAAFVLPNPLEFTHVTLIGKDLTGNFTSPYSITR